MITVAVIDDESLVRSGLRLILESVPDISVLVAASGDDAIEQINETPVDVVLLDLHMPGRGGLNILAELQSWEHPPRVAILTTFNTEAHAASALYAGASGFILKDTDPELLPALIRTLAGGGVVLSPEVSKNVFGQSVPRSVDSRRRLDSLSDRELDVLTHLSAGMSNTEIGAVLFLSSATVKDHVSSILAKLNVPTRLQAALIADRYGRPR